MPRVKRGITKHKKREKLMKAVKGFRWGRKNNIKLAKEAVLHAWSHAFVGRKQKKREYRSLWNVRINAAVREHGMKYSEFIHALKQKNIALDRKILSQIANENPDVFKQIVEEVRK